MKSEPVSYFSRLKLRAPSADRSWLIAPSPPIALQSACEARPVPSEAACGFDFEQVSQAARRETLAAACAHTGAYREISALSNRQGPLLMAGHQPQLFHPGVWFKNGVLDRLARACDGVPINLLVDNDLCTSTAIRIPAGALESPYFESVPLDAPGDAVPFEERRVLDESQFASADERIVSRLPDWLPVPMVRLLWQRLDSSANDRPLGERLAIARHRSEAALGWETLELPLSKVCDARSFRQFAVALWRDAVGLRDHYNQALFDYRQAYRIRSRSHPVPQLEQIDSWIETPFWVWQVSDPRRRRLFVKTLANDRLELTDLQKWHWEGTGQEWIERAAGEGSGVRVRSRALTTTWYARCVLSQSFVHGIGGAHYDRLTDQIIQRHWNWSPPGFVAATATVRLPVPRPESRSDEAGRIKQQLRELRFHPERALTGSESLEVELQREIEIKSDWIDPARSVDSYSQKVERHAAIVRANLAMQPKVAKEQHRLQEALVQWEKNQRIDRVLGSREFSLALFDQQYLADVFREAIDRSFV